MKSKHLKFSGTLLLLWHCTTSLFACGPEFPNTLLDGGDEAMLRAPVADFVKELQRMNLPAPLASNPATNGYAVQTAEMDVADLRTALKKAGVSASDRDQIVRGYKAERDKLVNHSEALQKWRNFNESVWEDGKLMKKDKGPAPALEETKVIEGLPGEFADYFRGAVAFHNGKTNEARQIWEQLLARPKEERHFRSIWAAYMLGKLSEEDDHTKATQYYTLVRSLAKQGFTDSLGLAAASLGWEARMALKEDNFPRAFDLYLQHAASGDPSAVLSLRFTARAAIESGKENLNVLAKDPGYQRVITAFLVARGNQRPRITSEDEKFVSRWLDAVEAAGVNDVESAELLALTAYQSGKMDVAQRWIKRARSSPTAQWLSAKLLMRSGRIDEAAALLSELTVAFPLNPGDTNALSQPTLQNSLYMHYPGNHPDQQTVGNRVLAELGAIRLVRREYQESLDALLRAGYWMDAAYVAERVLTVNELKSYVDRQWPAEEAREETATTASSNPVPAYSASELGLSTRKNIRYLLGRRMTRLGHGNQAGNYYPAKIRPQHEQFVQELNKGREQNTHSESRASHLFEAAMLARHQGMQLFGTEMAPDWSIFSGNYELGMTVDQRTTNASIKILVPDKDEIRRYKSHPADPDKRFHYRYQAAFLAWEAAQLLPDNSDTTAKMLCTGGAWLKDRDPKTADLFYKALVQRCPNTSLGQEANRLHWFPDLDEKGNILPRKSQRPATEPRATN